MMQRDIICSAILAVLVLLLQCRLSVGIKAAPDNEPPTTPVNNDDNGFHPWNYTEQPCLSELYRLVNMELDASIFYLNYGAYFLHHSRDLPGFASYFFRGAYNRRHTAARYIEYAVLRGQNPIDTCLFALDYSHKVPEGSSGEDALRAALEKHEQLIGGIRKLIFVCEQGTSDYNLSEYMKNVFLKVKHRLAREVADKIETLRKVKRSGCALGEFLFDKKNLD